MADVAESPDDGERDASGPDGSASETVANGDRKPTKTGANGDGERAETGAGGDGEATTLRLSPTVGRVRDALSGRGPVASAAVVEAVLERHPEYASGLASGVVVDERRVRGDRRSVDEWLGLVRGAFDAEGVPELNGRVVVAGLALLDPGLRGELDADGFLDGLEAELESWFDSPVGELLTDRGRWRREPDDSVRNQSDDPLERLDADRLLRAPFAGYLAERIVGLPPDRSGAYAIHLHGAWGSGKSTLLNFLRAELLARPVVRCSEPVLAATERVPENRTVAATRLAGAVLDAGGDGLSGSPSTAFDAAAVGENRRRVRAWLDAVRGLFDVEREPTLTAPLVVLGLALLEPELHRRLRETGTLDRLETVLDGPLDELLTAAGRERQSALVGGTDGGSSPEGTGESTDAVQLGEDEHAADPGDEDADDDGGSGGDVGDASDGDESADADEGGEDADAEGREHPAVPPAHRAWHVVEFNAWRHQHIRPPWWALLNHVFTESRDELSRGDLLREYGWRLASGHAAVYSLVVVVAGLAGLGLFLLGRAGLAGTSALADAGALLAGLVTLGALVRAVSTSLVFGSAHAAEQYVETANDPMRTIERRFTDLVDRIPKRVAILVDDLDRCRSEYVVELLEGVQTLFRGAPVVFVVAADGRWLNTCFETVYEDYRDTVREPGKPLGTLFLEKVFQSSAPVPGIPDDVRTAYFDGLLDVRPEEAGATAEEGRARVEGADSEGEILRVLDDYRDRPSAEGRAVREGAVRRLAAPEVVERTAHVLTPLAPLLDPNPRAMKLLVNAYSVNRALATLTDVRIGRERLALWTVLSLRWPALAAYLRTDPSAVERVGKEPPDGVDPALRPLFTEPAVTAVVHPSVVDATLTADAVERCTRLRA